jgi:hypothetical protein
MNATRKAAVRWAGASAVAVLLAATSAFADAPRHNRDQNGTNGRTTQAQTGRSGVTERQTPDQRISNQRNAGQGNNNQRVIDQRASDQVAAAQRAADSHNISNQQRSDRNDSRTTTVSNNQTRGYGNQSVGSVDQSSRYRDNQRVAVSGRVTSFNRERDGYRVQLDRNGSYWIPASRLGNRARDLRVGISLNIGGIFRGGAIGIDAVSWPVNASYGTGYGNEQGNVRGVIERVDYRSGILTLRDDATGRLLDVDTARGSRLDVNDVRPGDYVTLSGEWLGNDVFAAYRIDSVNTSRS